MIKLYLTVNTEITVAPPSVVYIQAIVLFSFYHRSYFLIVELYLMEFISVLCMTYILS